MGGDEHELDRCESDKSVKARHKRENHEKDDESYSKSQHKHKKKKKEKQSEPDKDNSTDIVNEDQVNKGQGDCSRTVDAIENTKVTIKKKKKKLKHERDESGDSHEKKSDSKRYKEVADEECSTKASSRLEPLEKGQWSNATFEDSERRQKFFRLLGGFKKKGDCDVGASSHFASKAMSKTEEKDMEQNLESQFVQAWEKRRTNRGMGLGYSADTDTKGKDFHIDKDNVRSIKFAPSSEET